MENSFKLPLNISVKELEEAAASPFFHTGMNILLGKYPGVSGFPKFGRTDDLQFEELPEDIWDGHGEYTGFPDGEPEEFEAFSTAPTDKGVLIIRYLASPESEDWQTAEIPVNGTKPMPSGVFGHRLHTARFDNGSQRSFNAGTITIRHRGIKENVFCNIRPARSQSTCAAITVPKNNTGFITRLFVGCIGNEDAQLSGGLWVREPNGKGGFYSPRMIRQFSVTPKVQFLEVPEVMPIELPETTDITIRIDGMSHPLGGLVTGGFDIVFVKNIV